MISFVNVGQRRIGKHPSLIKVPGLYLVTEM